MIVYVLSAHFFSIKFDLIALFVFSFSDADYLRFSNLGLPDDQVRSYRTSLGIDKPFKCLQCPSSYSRKACLTRHLKYECGQEPRFKCPYCDYRSKKTSSTYKHVRENHENCKVGYVDIYGISEGIVSAIPHLYKSDTSL